MAITSIRRDWGVGPSMVRITSTDSLSTCVESNYLTNQAPNIYAANSGPFTFNVGDMVDVTAADNAGIFQFSGNDFSTLVNLDTLGGMYNNVLNTMTSTGGIYFFKSNGTEATNTVTVDGYSGVITTSALTTPAGNSYQIVMTNPVILSTFNCFITYQGGTNTPRNITFQALCGPGTATIVIFNNDPVSALNGTIIFGYQFL